MKATTKRRVMDRKIVERLVLGDGMNVICRELKVSKRRVMMARARADEAGYFDGVSLPPYPEALFPESVDGRSSRQSVVWKLLDEHRSWIEERLEAGWHGVTVYEELPVRVPRSNFYRYLLRHGLSKRGVALRRVVPEIVHLPGEAVLVDWGHLWTVEISGKRTKVWAFIAILGFSRYMTVRIMTSCDLGHTLEAMRDVYETFGGVPRRTTSDNPKVFSLDAHKYEPILNPAYERFASHYGTVVECLPPRAPEKKGKVERPVSYVRRLLESYAGDRADIPAIQAHMDGKMAIANERRHGTTGERPIDRFVAEEKPLLRPLPLHPYEVESYHEGTVRRDGHVRFEGKYYSVEEQHIGKEVVVIGNSKTVTIYHEGVLLETHERLTDRYRSKSTKPHHRKPWERECDSEEGLLARAARIGPRTEALCRSILLSGDGFIDYRKIWGIMSLEKKYSADDVEAACDEAMELMSPSYHTVRTLCERRQEEKVIPEEEEKPERSKGKFQRDLKEYQQLLLNIRGKGAVYEQ